MGVECQQCIHQARTVNVRGLFRHAGYDQRPGSAQPIQVNFAKPVFKVGQQYSLAILVSARNAAFSAIQAASTSATLIQEAKQSVIASPPSTPQTRSRRARA